MSQETFSINQETVILSPEDALFRCNALIQEKRSELYRGIVGKPFKHGDTNGVVDSIDRKNIVVKTASGTKKNVANTTARLNQLLATTTRRK